jgi:PepSY-associated TM region
VMMALSGAVITFREDVESLHAPRSTATVRAVGSNLAAIQEQLYAHYPGARISRIIFPKTSTDVFVLQAETSGKKKVELYADPGSGTLLGPKKSVAWLDWLVDLHQNLLLGDGACPHRHYRVGVVAPERYWALQLVGGTNGLEANSGVAEGRTVAPPQLRASQMGRPVGEPLTLDHFCHRHYSCLPRPVSVGGGLSYGRSESRKDLRSCFASRPWGAD